MRLGIQRGLMGAVCGAWLGCSHGADEHSAEIRRQVLRVEDLQTKQARIVAEHRVLDPQGELIPSTTQVAGITLPRGFQPKFVFEHEWHFDGALPLRKVENYFSARLDASVQHPNTSTVEFAHATWKDAKEATSVSLTVLEIPGRKGWTRIHIRAPKPFTEILSEAETAMGLERRRRETE
jgi:hypothetical protein